MLEDSEGKLLKRIELRKGEMLEHGKFITPLGANREPMADTLEAVREVNAAESAEAALMYTTGEQTDWAEERLRAASERLRAAEVSLASCVEVLEYRTQTRFGCSDEVTT